MRTSYLRIYFLCIFFAFGMISEQVCAQVQVEAKIDSLEMLVGEQTKITLRVTLDAQQRAVFPTMTDTLVKGVELIETLPVDTQKLGSDQRMSLSQSYVVTAFDSALYYLPPMQVMVDGQAYASNHLVLKVHSIPVPIDSLNPDAIFGPKTVMDVPFAWEDWYALIACIFLLIPLVAALIYLVIRLKDNKPIIRKVKREPKLPPYQVAIAALSDTNAQRAWQRGGAKVYYTELTDVVRTFLKERMGFNALEMTSAEIMDKLMEVCAKEELSGVRSLFNVADLVKFAKYEPTPNEYGMHLIQAKDFIEAQKQPEDDLPPQPPTEETIVEPRSKRIKLALIGGVVGIVLGIVSVLIYAVVQLLELI